MATNPEFLNQGIATRLLHRLEADALKAKMTQIFVLTTQTAHWFLEKGFVEVELSDLPKQKQSLYNYKRNSRIFSKSLKN
jgi:amino-acid N-acetyltransferase